MSTYFLYVLLLICITSYSHYFLYVYVYSSLTVKISEEINIFTRWSFEFYCVFGRITTLAWHKVNHFEKLNQYHSTSLIFVTKKPFATWRVFLTNYICKQRINNHDCPSIKFIEKPTVYTIHVRWKPNILHNAREYSESKTRKIHWSYCSLKVN